ncbi:MAG TPA: PEP-CTERM sorting domain-containing protein [Acetobacteraceae bacterium]
MSIRLAAVAVLALCVPALPARAVPVTYDLTGTVTQIARLTNVPLSPGQVVPISIQVDTAATASPPGSGHYSSTLTFNPGSGLYSVILSALFDGQELSSLAQTINLTDTSISFATTGPQISYGFQLALSGAPSGTLSPGALPGALDPGLFTTRTFSVVDAFSATFSGYSGTVNGLAVPEPASLALLCTALLGLLARRQLGRRLRPCDGPAAARPARRGPPLA